MRPFIILVAVLFVCCAQLVAGDIYSLHPHPKEAYLKSPLTQFKVTKSVYIITDQSLDRRCYQAIHLFNEQLKNIIGDTLPVVQEIFAAAPTISFIQLGATDSSSLAFSSLPDAFLPDSEGYVIDADSTGITVFVKDVPASFNAVTTLLQLMTTIGPNTVVFACRIEDEPDYHDRWVFSGHNLLVTSQIDALKTIEDTMFMHKLNGLQQNDFKYNILDLMHAYTPWYFANVDSLKQYSDERNIAIIPGVAGIGYSDGILFNDPNLAEGAPAVATYYMESDTGRLIPDPNVTLPNGTFENLNANGDQFTGWSFYDGPNQSVFVDHNVYHSGNTSARCTNFAAGNSGSNCRFERSMACQPNHYYNMTAWCKTENFSGSLIQLLAIGSDGTKTQGLTFTEFSVPSTSNGWIQLPIAFNTFGNTQVSLYCGVWGGISGTIWWDDFQVQEAGLVNVLRRPGTPIKVWNKSTGKVYAESVDYAPIVDSIMLSNQGSYPYHTPVSFRRIQGGSIANGDSIMISFFHPLTVYPDNNSNGSVMVCVSEDTLYSILKHQIAGVDTLYHPQGFFLGHDEIRNMNRDSSCLKRGMTPAQLLDDNVAKCSQIVQNIEPNAKQFIWNDMFDSLHNAYNNYYFVNGDLTGDWNGLSHSLTIGNWNHDNREQSMQRFADMGFPQITAPYYDDNDTMNIRQWNITMRHIKNVQGEMYTTWANDYALLTPFADYAWNSAPYIFHTPIAINDTQFFANPSISALVYPDPVNDSDAIVNVVVGHTTCTGDSIVYDTLRVSSFNNYSGTLKNVQASC
ncbi:MAG TPA: hypothetical protein VFJ29_00320, partial [Candidatus Kapabacteria bacterium]|nr:hypothetical protein [Candidatus Kapabacteria bacterium]